jgi:glyoxylase-like metal-dependent hydrolase (beta-lactamase superfamily II)
MEAAVTALFDEATNTVSYIAADPATAKPAIVDCVLDFNPKSARTSTCSADRLIEAVRRQDLEVEWLLETHVHADHLSAAPVHQGEARGPYRHRRGGPRRAGNLPDATGA